MSTPLARFLFWAYLIFLVWVSGTQANPADPDLWHRLAVGEFLWKTGHFPLGETFSYLSDYQQLADHEWGSALVFYGLWQLGGPTAIILTKLVALGCTLGLIIWAGIGSRRPTVPMTAFYSLVLLALLPSFQSTVRCMIFTHLFFALWVCWYQRERQGRRVPLFLYPATMVLWANLHGGFVIGLLWLAVNVAIEAVNRRDWRPWARRLGLCLFATLINPFGAQLWVATVRALVITRRGFGEWAPVEWIASSGISGVYPGYKLLLVCVVVALAIQLYRKGWRRLDQPGLVFIGLFMLLALDSARHTSLFALVAGAFIPNLFPLKWPSFLRSGPIRRLGTVAINCALIIVPFFSALIVMPGAELQLEYPPVACPVGAVDFLETKNIRGDLLVPFNYGSYALWELRGQMRVSMDGRYDLVYKPATYRRVEDFFLARQGWPDLLTATPPAAILVPRIDDIYFKLKNDPAWKEAYRNLDDAVFLPR